MSELLVRHAHGSYPVRIGPGLADGLADVVKHLAPDARPFVITDHHVDSAWPGLLPGVPRLVFPAGESHKTRATWGELTDRLLASGADRHAVIVALGGGVTGDLAGFVAATCLRGIRWVAVPTSTLAMLDAAVGGKTGVDTEAGKNLVGAFHPPIAVIADPALLATLPADTFREGLAEAVKHAAIASPDMWQWLEAHAAAILERDDVVLAELVHRSLAIKAEVVEGDEREAGRRAILNAGHTTAHALEHATRFAIRHGEAVAIGLVVEARIAESHSLAAAGTADRIASLLGRLGLPTACPRGVDIAAFRAALVHDKKNRAGEIHATLLAGIGAVARSAQGGWTQAIDPDRLADLLQGN